MIKGPSLWQWGGLTRRGAVAASPPPKASAMAGSRPRARANFPRGFSCASRFLHQLRKRKGLNFAVLHVRLLLAVVLLRLSALEDNLSRANGSHECNTSSGSQCSECSGS